MVSPVAKQCTYEWVHQDTVVHRFRHPYPSKLPKKMSPQITKSKCFLHFPSRVPKHDSAITAVYPPPLRAHLKVKPPE